jgi:hypothetical protein
LFYKSYNPDVSENQKIKDLQKIQVEMNDWIS